MQIFGLDYLRNKLEKKQSRLMTRYKYYEMKSRAQDFKISTPPELQWYISSLGWCGKAVDSLADRLNVSGIKNDALNMWDIFQDNNADVLFDSAIKSALIGSCSFIYIYLEDKGIVKMEVFDGKDATGIMDMTTGFLSEGYAVLDRDDNGTPIDEIYTYPGMVEHYQMVEDKMELVEMTRVNSLFPPLVPIVYRPDAKRPFGHSRISRACMSLQDSAIRTVKRSEIAAEFYSYPQKWVTGLSQDIEPLDKWKATMSSMLMMTKDNEGDHPIFGQFSQANFAPHLEQLRMFASLFAGETGLTLDDLGFASGNPSSADAIKSQHEGLRLTARKAQKTFGSGFLNAGLVAASMKDDTELERNAIKNIELSWLPVFEPDGSSLSGLGDAIIKINQAVPGFVTAETMKELTGIVGGAEDGGLRPGTLG